MEDAQVLAKKIGRAELDRLRSEEGPDAKLPKFDSVRFDAVLRAQCGLVALPSRTLLVHTAVRTSLWGDFFPNARFRLVFIILGNVQAIIEIVNIHKLI